MYKARATERAMAILANTTHPLYSEFCPLPSGKEVYLPKTCQIKQIFEVICTIKTVGFLNKL